MAVGQGMPFHSSVSVAKAGIEGLTKSLAAELAPSIRVNCIAPTITRTDMAQRILRNEKIEEILLITSTKENLRSKRYFGYGWFSNIT